MKNFLLGGIAAFVLMTIAPASAADLGRRPVYKAPPPVPVAVPVFSWTGCYIGGHVGYGWGRDRVSIPNLAATAEVPPEEVAGISVPPATADTRGPIGGGQVGCDYQFAPNWVIGLEGAAAAADIKGDLTRSVPFTIPGDGTVVITGTAHGKTEWLTSVTGRLGWAWDRWLIYGKGGAAWAGDRYSLDIPIFGEHDEARVTRTGWTVGAGIEWAFWNNWSAKVEYDFYDFGTRSVTLAGTLTGGPTLLPPGPVTVPGVDINERISTVKVGINYRFGWGGVGPTVARY
jgi:outer membrane immunogenic protein